MGMPVLTIDREPSPTADRGGEVAAAADGGGQEVAAAGGLQRTDAPSTPTYLSTESLTFTGATTVGIAVVAIIGQMTNAEATPTVIVIVAGVLGAFLIIFGLFSPTNRRGGRMNMAGQIILGLFNSVLLASALLGVYKGTG